MLHLSPVYAGVGQGFWMMVYHTQADSSEVELVTNKLFKSKKKALKWFARKHRHGDFIQPEAVQVWGFDRLSLIPDRVGSSLPWNVPVTATGGDLPEEDLG
jgi:hypothetical protein